MGLRFTSATLTKRGVLELDLGRIARNYAFRGSFLIDVMGILPLEIWLSYCRWGAAPSCFDNVILLNLNWQWLKYGRWFLRWRSHDSFRSITATSNDGALNILKYFILIILVLHTATCLMYSAAQSGPPHYSPVCSEAMFSLPAESIGIAVLKHNDFDKQSMFALDVATCKTLRKDKKFNFELVFGAVFTQSCASLFTLEEMQRRAVNHLVSVDATIGSDGQIIEQQQGARANASALADSAVTQSTWHAAWEAAASDSSEEVPAYLSPYIALLNSLEHPLATNSTSPLVLLMNDLTFNMYLYYFYSVLGNLLGDGSSAKNAATRLWSTIFMLVGYVLFALVFGEVMLAMQAIQRSRDAFAHRMQAINEALEFAGVPQRFQKRVRRFYEYVWMSQRSAKITKEYLEELPSALRIDIITASYAKLLRKMPFFETLQDDCLSFLAQKLESFVFMPDEIILKEGLLGRSMYFIEAGQVRIIKARGSDQEKLLGVLGDGSFFGEIAVAQPEGKTREATVISATVLRLQRVTRAALEDVGRLYPEVMAYIHQVSISHRRDLGEEIRAMTNVLPLSHLFRLKGWSASARSSLQVDSASAEAASGEADGKSTSPNAARPRSMLTRVRTSAGLPTMNRMRTSTLPYRPRIAAAPRAPATTDDGKSPPSTVDDVTELADGGDTVGGEPPPLLCEDVCEPSACGGSAGTVGFDHGGGAVGGGVASPRKVLAEEGRADEEPPEWLKSLQEVVRALGASHGIELEVVRRPGMGS